MNELMTQGFTELDENEIEAIDGGTDWWGVTKGCAQALWGSTTYNVGYVYGKATGNWNVYDYGYSQTKKAANKIVKALFS